MAYPKPARIVGLDSVLCDPRFQRAVETARKAAELQLGLLTEEGRCGYVVVVRDDRTFGVYREDAWSHPTTPPETPPWCAPYLHRAQKLVYVDEYGEVSAF